MARAREFQSEDYRFAKYLWFNFYFADRAESGVIPFVLYSAYGTKTEAREAIQEVYDHFDTSDITIFSEVLTIKIRFQELLPLHKEYWQRAEYEIDRNKEIQTLLQSLLTPALYYYVVTPSLKDTLTNEVVMGVGTAVLKTNTDQIPLWMRNSTMPVIPESKHAALYVIDSLYLYDSAKSKFEKIDSIPQYFNVDIAKEKYN